MSIKLRSRNLNSNCLAIRYLFLDLLFVIKNGVKKRLVKNFDFEVYAAVLKGFYSTYGFIQALIIQQDFSTAVSL